MTTPTPKADRFHRAPRGGAVSAVNGRFYKGGCFMPLNPAEFKPGPVVLTGSVRQVLWATRLRRQALARLDDELSCRRLMLADRKVVDEEAVRRAIRRDAIALHGLMTERSAGAIIDRRATLAN